MRYELSDYEWNRHQADAAAEQVAAAFGVQVSVACSMASFGSCVHVRHGAICQRHMVPHHLSQSLRSLGGLASGTRSWKRWPPAITRRCR